MVGTSRLDLACLIVVPVDRAQVDVAEQVAGDADLCRRRIGDLGGRDVPEEVEIDRLAEGRLGALANGGVEGALCHRAALGRGPETLMAVRSGKARPEVGEVALNRGGEILGQHRLVGLPVLGFGGCKGEVPAAASLYEVAVELDHGEVAPADRAAGEQGDHQAIAIGPRAFERVALTVRLLHQAAPEVDQLGSCHHAPGFAAAGLPAAFQAPDDRLEPRPVLARRHDPERVIEVLGVVEDAGGGDLGIQMIKIGPELFPGHSLSGEQGEGLGFGGAEIPQPAAVA